ncbi:hypothetical protein HCG49_16935 [Arenibacter sp. 6A1]|uniref:hypothetical protein n=1 Tax=Arenibacter sp. 6A1 TaxID=2720391 RepID=UPI0014452058|nr:hypothetical protein [Arenibacter sp. 6A1]NKI28241.1 hypothetical protein [Arenibacter sp. 6A1]
MKHLNNLISIIGLDKIVHAETCLIGVVLIHRLLSPYIESNNLAALLAFVITIVIGAIRELAGNEDIKDKIANSIGATAGLVYVIWINN